MTILTFTSRRGGGRPPQYDEDEGFGRRLFTLSRSADCRMINKVSVT